MKADLCVIALWEKRKLWYLMILSACSENCCVDKQLTTGRAREETGAITLERGNRLRDCGENYCGKERKKATHGKQLALIHHYDWEQQVQVETTGFSPSKAAKLELSLNFNL